MPKYRLEVKFEADDDTMAWQLGRRLSEVVDAEGWDPDVVSQPYRQHKTWDVVVGPQDDLPATFADAFPYYDPERHYLRHCARCSGTGTVSEPGFERRCPDCGGFGKWPVVRP